MVELLNNVVVVLVRPRFPENIGAAARVMANMGLGRPEEGGLRCVEPERPWERPMERLATAQGMPYIAGMRVHDDLDAALGDTVAAFATTARTGRDRGLLYTPRQATAEVLDWAEEGKVALVFGPEDKGLTTRELDRARFSICIPTSDESSLNLAQAVMVLAYELRSAALEAGGGEGVILPGRRRSQAPARREEIAALHGHLLEALTRLGTLDARNPEHFYLPFRAVLDRSGLTAREVRAWHGLARKALWAAERAKGALEEDET